MKKVTYKCSTASTETVEYSYDNLDRIIQYKYNTSMQESYGYDAYGNLTPFTGNTRSYSASNNRLTGDGSRTIAYDGAGRVITLGSNTLTWDCFKNLTAHCSDS